MRITFEASTLTASKDDRTVTGVLVPYGEKGKTNLGMFSVPRGAFELPTDPAAITLNVEHAREAVIGHGVRLTDSPEGVLLAAYVAKTPEGDQVLDQIERGELGFFSAEVAGVAVENGQAVAGRLFGSALVKKPAFPSATLLASLVEDEDGNTETVIETETEAEGESEATTTVEKYTDEITDEDGNTSLRETTTTTVVDGNTTTITTETVVVEPEETTEEEENIVSTLTASARRGATRPAQRQAIQVTEHPKPDLSTLFAAMSEAKTTRTPEAMNTLLAALTEIKTNGSLSPAQTGVAGNKGAPDNWVGQLWDGREYDRRFINLFNHGTEITAQGKRGFTAHRGTKAAPKTRNDGTWAGNLTEINGATAHIVETGSNLHKWALAEAIAREFFDLPGGEVFLEAFFKLLVEDYAMWSDEKALSIALTRAGAVIAPEEHLTDYPAQLQYPKAMQMVIQGARLLTSRKDAANFAIVNKAAYDELVYTPKDLVPEFITFDVATERNGSADAGKIVIVEAYDEDAELFVNLDGDEVVDPDKPAVLVGAKHAIDFDELGSTPFTVDALEIARGGIDRAVHGYLQEFTRRTRSLALIGTAVTP